MLFTLEALEAKWGDSLLLHFGTAAKPRLVVIDGGPSGVYVNTLKKRLDALKASRSPGAPLPIRMLMVSHIDDDHVNGVLALAQKLDELRQQHKALPYDIVTLWHNSFDDILGNDEQEITASLGTAIQTASIGGALPGSTRLSREGALVLAGVPQGRDLRNCAKALSLTLNEGFKGLVMAPKGKKSPALSLGTGLSFTVLGPREDRIRDLQEEWDKQIKKLGVAKTAAFVDSTVTNLSSIIVLAKAGKRTMLLAGDARGDDIIGGLKNAKVLTKDTVHFDLFKIPHHGSDRNVSSEFFRQVTADHYVISANGRDDNPETTTLSMILAARGSDQYTIHLTNREPRLVKFFDKERKQGGKFSVIYRDDGSSSIRVDLGDPLKD